MVNNLTIAQALKKGMEILEEGDFSNPLLELQLLLCYTLNVDKIYIYTHRDQKIDRVAVDKFLSLVKKRSEGYPLQYILKKQEFMGLDFYIEEGVLIPRPDTEILVEAVIDIVKTGYFKERNRINIVDIGTGSGVITLSLAYYIKNSFVYSIDISEKALTVAIDNCRRFRLQDKVKFVKGSLLNPLKEFNLENSIDIIVSNPPYIPSNEIQLLQSEVSKYEPRTALDGGMDGLDFYRNIIIQSKDYLVSGGLIAFEIGYNQGNQVKGLLNDRGYFKDIKIIKDLSGHDRVVVAYKGV